MTGENDRLLSNAGGLLMAAGFIAAITGGTYGLSTTRPGLVVLSVLLLMGYSVVGWLLMNRGAQYFHVALPTAAFLVLLTLFLFRQDMRGVFDDGFAQFILYPALALVLAYAGGALLTHALEELTHRVSWPGRGSTSLNTLLHVAAYSPVWNAFTLLSLMVNPSAGAHVLIIGVSVLVAVAMILGGYAASRRSHPLFTVAGASIGFLASVLYLFQFMLGGGGRDIAWFGQFNALLGLILTGFPVAIAAVAWIQIANEEPADGTVVVGPSE